MDEDWDDIGFGLFTGAALQKFECWGVLFSIAVCNSMLLLFPLAFYRKLPLDLKIKETGSYSRWHSRI